MGLLLVGLGIVAFVLFVVAMVKLEVALSVFSMLFVVAIMLCGTTVGSQHPFDYHYWASIQGVGSIDFKDYSQDGQVVTIKGYAVEGATHWLDFKRYNLHQETIIVQVPDGKAFDYSVINTPVQKVIKTEASP
jgi:hypothetical protein